MSIHHVAATFIGLASLAAAQSEIVGVNLRLNEAFTSSTTGFVANYLGLDQINEPIRAIDFDAAGSVLWGVNHATLEIVNIDTVTGTLTTTGIIANGTGLGGATGLTASPNGADWYLSYYDGADSVLFRGDVTTGSFTQVGIINSELIIDIAMAPNGDLYGHSISDDSLYSIDPATGAGTLVGATGVAAGFAQGMDFDPSTGVLYATIYIVAGDGEFCSLDLTTGQATLLESTLPLNAEMEIAIRPGAGPVTIGTNYCSTNANSTGQAGVISATGSTSVAMNNVTLMASQLPNTSFGFFVASPTQGFVMNPAGSAGNLCLGGTIGRYVGPGQIQSTGQVGNFSLAIDLTAVPTPGGPMMIQAGQNYNFQAWHRDTTSGGMATSNFTDGLEIAFQ